MGITRWIMEIRPEVYAIVICLVVTHIIVCRQRQIRQYEAYSRVRGFKPPPRLYNRLPLGADRLIQMSLAGSQHTLPELVLGFFRVLGSTFEIVFLSARSLGTIDPKNIESILNSNSHDWSLDPRDKIMGPLLGDGIFTQNDVKGKKSRDTLRPHLAVRHFEDLKVFDEHVHNLVTALPSEGVVDIQPFIFQFTLDVITGYLFGKSTFTLRHDTDSGFAYAFNEAQDTLAKRLRLMNAYWIVDGSSFRKACKIVHNFADEIIEGSFDKGKQMGKSIKSDSISPLLIDCPDRTQLRSQIINLLVAGRDSTACAITWTLYLLVRHPQVLTKLRDEAAELFSTVPVITRENLNRLSYLQNVLREALRLYPPIPMNSRTAIRDTHLPTGGGEDGQARIFIRKGEAVGWSPYCLHRDPRLWGMDAELFRPERWEDNDTHLDAVDIVWRYLPFNGGPRRCLGEDFGMTEAALAIARLVVQFPNMKLPHGEKIYVTGREKQSVTLVLTSTEGCRVDLG